MGFDEGEARRAEPESIPIRVRGSVGGPLDRRGVHAVDDEEARGGC